MRRTSARPLIGLAIALAVVAAGIVLRSRFQTQAASMLSALTHLRPATVLEILAFGTIAAILSGVEWWRLLHRLGYPLPFRAALTAYLSAGLGGYVMNSVGPALGCAASLRQHGVSPGRAALLTVIANALGFCGILFWTPLGLLVLARSGVDRTLPIIGGRGPLAADLALLIMAVVMLFVLRALASASTSRNRLARRLLGSVPRADGEAPPLCSRHLLALAPWSAASWVVGVGSMYVVLAAMNPGGGAGLTTVIGASALAAGLGSLAFFVPEGVGVSESAVAVLMAHATGIPVTTTLAAALAVRALDPLTKLCLLGILALSSAPAVARLVDGAQALSPRSAARSASAVLGALHSAALILYRRAALRGSPVLRSVRAYAGVLAAAGLAIRRRVLDDPVRSVRTALGTTRIRIASLLALCVLLASVTVLLPRSTQAHPDHDSCRSSQVGAQACRNDHRYQYVVPVTGDPARRGQIHV